MTVKGTIMPDLWALRHVDDFCDGPHEGAIDAHQFLMVNLVRLVEDDPDLRSG